jgi:chaperone modulatory protein CbpM
MAIREHSSIESVGGGMTMRTGEFLMQARLDAQVLDAWIEAGWLRPGGHGSSREFSNMNFSDLEFSDIDLARARLICDLRSDLGVNDEAIPVVLDLIDQIHGLRRLVRELVERSQP